MAPFLFIVCIGTFVALIIWWTNSGAQSMLNGWAHENGYEIVSREHRWIRKGPFFWKSSKNQIVFYVTVSDSEGKVRTGYVRCGGYFIGLLGKQVDVIWDNEPQTQAVSEPQSSPRPKAAPTEFALKKPGQWLWRTRYSSGQVLKRLDDMLIDENCLICPQGEADRAITVGEFVADPNAFGSGRDVEVTSKASQPTAAEPQTVSKPQASSRAKAAPTQFAIKKPGQWWWRTNHTAEQVLERFGAMKIDEDWLICPQGEAGRAITIGEFVADPNAFG